ncbi:hypothetical protein HDF10_000920 [Edaphobacter lichenicola]|uniref:Uncharacterized protein n=1 Tax=Tunturiibacter lichenicola TaxID=2051959 RepID=A0A7W8J5M7_9BACT|nr:hypothetical protein [Edaphobacter lichenicola]
MDAVRTGVLVTNLELFWVIQQWCARRVDRANSNQRPTIVLIDRASFYHIRFALSLKAATETGPTAVKKLTRE